MFGKGDDRFAVAFEGFAFVVSEIELAYRLYPFSVSSTTPSGPRNTTGPTPDGTLAQGPPNPREHP